jgi:hypothetical protein
MPWTWSVSIHMGSVPRLASAGEPDWDFWGKKVQQRELRRAVGPRVHGHTMGLEPTDPTRDQFCPAESRIHLVGSDQRLLRQLPGIVQH